MQWLRRFLYGDDPVQRLVSALTESEAEMYRELLVNNDVPAFTRNTSALAVYRSSLEGSFDLLVKASDVERARDILASLLEEDDHGA